MVNESLCGYEELNCMRHLPGLFCSGAVLLLATAASADVGYVFDVTTFYQFGNPSGGALNNVSANPDTGFFAIQNNGSTTFTGTLGDLAISNFCGDLSFTSSLLTLAPSQSVTIGVGPLNQATDSSNCGGYNGPLGSPQPGVAIQIDGLVNGIESIHLSVSDADIHSGVSQTSSCDGISSDSYVLQGGSPTGCDNGDGFETAQAAGHFRFAQTATVPEPGYVALVGVVLPVMLLIRRRAAAK
jgi:hypothetical protein